MAYVIDRLLLSRLNANLVNNIGYESADATPYSLSINMT